MEGAGDSDFGEVSNAQTRVSCAPDLGGHWRGSEFKSAGNQGGARGTRWARAEQVRTEARGLVSATGKILSPKRLLGVFLGVR